MTQIRIDYNPKSLQVTVPLQIIMPNQGAVAVGFSHLDRYATTRCQGDFHAKR